MVLRNRMMLRTVPGETSIIQCVLHDVSYNFYGFIYKRFGIFDLIRAVKVAEQFEELHT